MTDEKYPNPVHDLPKEDRKVVTVDIVAKDWLLLKGCDLTHGSLTATFNILVSKLANECRKRGIIDFSKSDQFRELVQSVSFVPGDSCVVTREELDELRQQSTDYQRILSASGGLRDRAIKGPTRKGHGRTIGRRTSSKGDKDKATTNASSLQSGGGSGDTTSEGQAVSGEVGETGS